MSEFGPVPYVCTTNRSPFASIHEVPGAHGLPCFAFVPAISHVFFAWSYTRYVSVKLRLPSLGLIVLNLSSMIWASWIRRADQVPRRAGQYSLGHTSWPL